MLGDHKDISPYKLNAAAWWFAPFIAISPALAVALLAGYAPTWADAIRILTLVWGASAFAAIISLSGWHMMTSRFSDFSLSTILAISAVVGAFAGMIATLTSVSSTDSIVRFLAAMAGAFQGAAVAWFLVGPTSPQAAVEEGAEEPDDDPNPPTSSS